MTEISLDDLRAETGSPADEAVIDTLRKANGRVVILPGGEYKLPGGVPVECGGVRSASGYIHIDTHEVDVADSRSAAAQIHAVNPEQGGYVYDKQPLPEVHVVLSPQENDTAEVVPPSFPEPEVPEPEQQEQEKE
jgi:hypothetical protein